jgi:hypothetical protein
MTENEKELLALVLAGQSVSDYTTRFNELRTAVLVERLPKASKTEWQAAYRMSRLARVNLDQVTTDLGLKDLNLAPWKKEIEGETP